MNSDSEDKRLNKFLSESGFCSRREADKLISEGRVTINGQPPALGVRVTASDRVVVDGKHIKHKSTAQRNFVYLAYNKPIGITCTTDTRERDNIVDAVNYRQRIFPIGRLDKQSEGLIFLTSDGDIVNKILRAENAHDKEYVVTVDKPIHDAFIQRMSNGVPILNTVTKKCRVQRVGTHAFNIVLTQGLNRQIRRMCEFLGYEVTKLKRVRIMNVVLGGLKSGQWRELTSAELAELQRLVVTSTKTTANNVMNDEAVDNARRVTKTSAKANIAAPRARNATRHPGRSSAQSTVVAPKRNTRSKRSRS